LSKGKLTVTIWRKFTGKSWKTLLHTNPLLAIANQEQAVWEQLK
jgi:hypothetical protein